MLWIAILGTVVVALQYGASMYAGRGNGLWDLLMYHSEIAIVISVIWVLYAHTV